MENLECPKCGCDMTIGSPHDEDCICQYECHKCGVYIGINRDKTFTYKTVE